MVGPTSESPVGATGRSPGTLESLLDAIFAPKVSEWSPGYAVAVVRGDQVVTRCYGLASLEQRVAITPQTRFRIASIAKQFTCAAMLRLAARGQLRVDEDFRTYLPDMPDFGTTITLRHLATHSSGWHSKLELMALAGATFDQTISHDDVMAMFRRQRTLNFPPGDRFLYCNTGYTLLSAAIERVAGVSLADVFKREIFAPLGMADSDICRHDSEVFPGMATPYLRAERAGQYKKALYGYPVSGEGGVITSLDDLLRWNANFDADQLGIVADLQTPGRLNDGSASPYALGVLVRDYRGRRMVSHSGHLPGFKSEFIRFPDHGVAVICLSNDEAATPFYDALQVADAVFADGALAPADLDAPTRAALCGTWFERDGGALLETRIRDDRLHAALFGDEFPMLAAGGRRYRGLADVIDVGLELDPAAIGAGRLPAVLGCTQRVTFERAGPDKVVTPNDYLGVYWSDELESAHRVQRAGESLSVVVDGLFGRPPPMPLTALAPDVFMANAYRRPWDVWMTARFTRARDGAVDGMLVSTARIRNLRLARRIAR